jgi:hypothetical protein
MERREEELGEVEDGGDGGLLKVEVTPRVCHKVSSSSFSPCPTLLSSLI